MAKLKKLVIAGLAGASIAALGTGFTATQNVSAAPDSAVISSWTLSPIRAMRAIADHNKALTEVDALLNSVTNGVKQNFSNSLYTTQNKSVTYLAPKTKEFPPPPDVYVSESRVFSELVKDSKVVGNVQYYFYSNGKYDYTINFTVPNETPFAGFASFSYSSLTKQWNIIADRQF